MDSANLRGSEVGRTIKSNILGSVYWSRSVAPASFSRISSVYWPYLSCQDFLSLERSCRSSYHNLGTVLRDCVRAHTCGMRNAEFPLWATSLLPPLALQLRMWAYESKMVHRGVEMLGYNIWATEKHVIRYHSCLEL
jgi:hypothetical protein